MKIIYLGQELDITKEHELNSENEFGFKVDIRYTKDGWYPTKDDTAYNCTEVHHLWSNNYMGGASIAFESDIHSTGFTRRIDDIETINIELAAKAQIAVALCCVIGAFAYLLFIGCPSIGMINNLNNI